MIRRMDLPAYYVAPDKRCLFRLHASVAVIDSEGRVLLVQEAKQSSRDKWNLPGGHVDHGESIPAAAARETREETGIDAHLRGLVGVYSGPVSARFVFRADVVTGAKQALATAGDEILAVRWIELDELLNTADAELVSTEMLKQIARDLQAGKLYPIELLKAPTM